MPSFYTSRLTLLLQHFWDLNIRNEIDVSNLAICGNEYNMKINYAYLLLLCVGRTIR